MTREQHGIGRRKTVDRVAMQEQCGHFTVQNFDGTEVGPTIGLEDSKAFSVADMGEPASSAVSISSPGSVSII